MVIPRNARFVRLQLEIESEAEPETLRASLQRVGTGEVWKHTFHRARANKRSKALTMQLPASLFARGDYLFTLTGTTPTAVVGDYPFTVAKQGK